MKKIFIFIIVGILLIAGGIFILNKKIGITLPGPTQFGIENVMPEKPILYVEFRNTGMNFNKIIQTPFWKRISGIDFDVILADAKLNEQEKMVFQMLKKFFENPKENEIFNKFFSKDVAVAIYEPALNVNTLAQAGPGGFQILMDELLSKFYLISRLDAQAQLTEIISSSFSSFGENVKIEDESYKDQEIKIVSIQGIPYQLVYTRVKDLLIVGVGKFSVQKSIDVFLGATNSMEKDQNYLLARSKFVKNPDVKTYFDMENLFSILEKKFMEMPGANAADSAEMKKQMEQTFASVKGFKSANMSSNWTDLVEMKFDIIFDLKTMSGAMAKYYASCKNEENGSINLIPSNMLAYIWGNCFDLGYYWEETKKELELSTVPGQPSGSEQIAQYEKMIGLTMEGDILPAFGDEIGGYIKDIHVDRNFPIPELLLFIKIKDQSKAERLLGLLKNQPAVMFQNENYNGVNLNYISLPIAEYVSPGYCFLNDYLLIAVNKELLKGSIDASKNNSTTLTSNASFKILNKGLTSKNIGVQFYKVDELSFKLAAILEWSNSWVAANDQKKEAFKDGAKLRLTQVQKNIEEFERSLRDKEQIIKDLEAKIKEGEASGTDVTSDKTNLQELKTEADNYRQDIESNVQEAIDIEDTIKAYSSGSGDSEKRKVYLDHVVFPIIDSFKVIEGVGIVSTISPDAMETSLFMKL